MCAVKCIIGEQRLPLGGSRHCLFLECCTSELLPDIISHGQYIPYMVCIVGCGGLKIEARPPPLGSEHSLAGFGIVPPWEVRHLLARVVSFFPQG